ncbi:MAG TPA: chromate resistance protein ChrB domain-containing protein [Steroidobacteraceae bacterium]|nr:chromate resistance protein ChrB domain-containing protein [Steroidobacteraceae bacterium]
MPPNDSSNRWLTLAFALPAQPAYARVKVWRRLQKVGAVSFKNALYWLPGTDAALEDFEWILREIRELGGEGLILESRALQGFTDGDIRALFERAREEDYGELAREVQSLLSASERKRDPLEAADIAAQVARQRERLKAIEAIDFFQSNGREQVHSLLRSLEARAPQDADAAETSTPEPRVQSLRGRVWVTRAHVHVDRMASAWLIRRSIDRDARFKFVTERHYRPSAGEVRFDMYEAEFTHDAERCTFEVLLDQIGRPDAALRAIGEIIHDLDLKDQRYERPETAGVGQLLNGIARGTDDDEERLRRSAEALDNLYLALSRTPRGGGRTEAT